MEKLDALIEQYESHLEDLKELGEDLDQSIEIELELVEAFLKNLRGLK